MTFPVPPSPATWVKNQSIRAPRLRADAANLAWLYTKRPLFFSTQVTSAQNISNNTTTSVFLDTTYIDNWLGHASPTSTTYSPPLSGWYLAQGTVSYVNASIQTGYYAAGIHVSQNSVGSNLLNSVVVPFSGGGIVSNIACDLVQLTANTSDSMTLIALQTQGVSNGIDPPTFLKAEWIALPSTGASVVTGTVVASPPTPVLWPPGSGTQLTNGGGIAAGATSMTVANTQGMIVNGTLGLEYYQGNAVSSIAESVNITSIVGNTIGITATSYAHAQNAYVSIPVSAAFLNNQVRDMVNFLAYPPIARLHNFGGSQSLAAQTFPAATAINFQAATVDNFSGWTGGVGTSSYTVPLSGVYFVYGQVAFNAGSENCSAGISIAGGTVQWGDSIRTAGTSLITCPTVSKLLRITSGQTVQLMGTTTVALGLSTANSSFYSTLIVVWRGF